MEESSKHLITRQDCTNIIHKITNSLCRFTTKTAVDFLIYGSCHSEWRDGLSDLDGILYFRDKRPSHPAIRDAFFNFQHSLALMYEEINFLSPDFFADIFIIDELHGSDGRFMVLDKGFLERPNYYQEVLGVNFLNKLRGVSLRNQDEFYLSHGLHKLRNYLMFETPINVSRMSLGSAKDALKYLLVLPREASKVLGVPTFRFPDAVTVLQSFFPNINYDSIWKLKEKSLNYNALMYCLRSWHEKGNDEFINAVECFELTLSSIVVKNAMISRV